MYRILQFSIGSTSFVRRHAGFKLQGIIGEKEECKFKGVSHSRKSISPRRFVSI